MFRKMLVTLAIAGVALTASACNTVKGVGRDIESVGQAGSDAMHK
ncbi:MAG: entericidin A/B family lipoprotein [Sphingomonadales bacterium]|nr:entericidin A/B family lipoprotein [Sphingomonadales bacterium]MBU3994075.1 entericidin A/B family lipoprotein [Alphaproteobacteria bacterium]